MDNRNPSTSSWQIRRRFMFIVSGFCMAVIFFVLWKDLTSGAAETAVSMGFATLLGIVSSYVFGAAWEDINVIKSKTKLGE
ncbi:holin [Pseudomonas phage ZQG1]|nr:holin [Pseudomonas phage ZQG1]